MTRSVSFPGILGGAFATILAFYLVLTLSARADTLPSADAFVDSIGVNTHFGYGGTPYTISYGQERKALLESGIRHIRDGLPSSSQDYLDKLRDLCNHGIKHSIGFTVTVTRDVMSSSLQTFGPQCIDFVEPQNEVDLSNRADWPQLILAEQRLLYEVVHGDPSFRNVVVLGPALGNSGNYSQLGNIEAFMDAGNTHYSVCDQMPEPISTHRLGLDFVRPAIPTKPVWTTETQYSDNEIRRRCFLPDSTIATYVPRSIAQHFLIGEPRTYWYEFSDQPTDGDFGRLGFVDASGQPKPQYVAVRSLISELADPGAHFTSKQLAYKLVRRPDKLAELLLARRDGSYDLLLWREIPASNGSSAVREPQQFVTVALPQRYSHVTLASYLASWKFSHKRYVVMRGRVTVPVTSTLEILKIAR